MLTIIKTKHKVLYLKKEKIFDTNKNTNFSRINVFSNYNFFLTIIFLFVKKKYKKIYEIKNLYVFYDNRSKQFISIWFFDYKDVENLLFFTNKTLTSMPTHTKLTPVFKKIAENKPFLLYKKFKSQSRLEALNFHNKLFKFYSYFQNNENLIQILNNYPQKIPNIIFKFFSFNCFIFDLNNQYGFILKNLSIPIFNFKEDKQFIRTDTKYDFFLVNQKPIYNLNIYVNKQKKIKNLIFSKLNRLNIPFWKVLFNVHQKKINFLSTKTAKKNFKFFILYNYGRLSLKHDIISTIDSIKLIKKIIFKNILKKNNELIINSCLSNPKTINYIDTDSLFSIQPFSVSIVNKKLGYLKILEFLNLRYKFFYVKSLKRYLILSISKDFFWIILKYKSRNFYTFNLYVFLRNLVFLKKTNNLILNYNSLSIKRKTNV